MNESLLQDPSRNGPLLLALQRAIVETFSESDWREIGLQTGRHNYLENHKRLFRSLSYQDADYGSCVHQVLKYFVNYDVRAISALVQHEKILPILEQTQSQILAQLGLNSGHVAAVVPTLSASEVVRRALSDVDQLIATNGAQSAVDRLHTAMHGYLRTECKEAGIQIPDTATLTQAFKALRTEHPALSNLGNHGPEVAKVLQSFAAVLDALNTIRNHGSVAHPTERLIEPAEASLFVNAVRTLFHYLSNKLAQ